MIPSACAQGLNPGSTEVNGKAPIHFNGARIAPLRCRSNCMQGLGANPVSAGLLCPQLALTGHCCRVNAPITLQLAGAALDHGGPESQ